MAAPASLNAQYAPHMLKILLGLLILLAAVPLTGGLFEPDSALYACISKHMALTNDFVNLYANGTDWLDKPHLPFWLTAVSFKVFGINAFAYKLPSYLISVLGLRYLYALGKGMVNEHTGLIAGIIYFSALHFLISSYDVRAEIYLASFTIGAIYYLWRAQQSAGCKNILFAAVFTAAGLMTKGLFVLLPIMGGFIYVWLVTRNWRQFFRAKWYLYLVLTAVFTLPEIIALYLQFDAHPEKIVFGRQHTSGIRFFLWDSQFGRFFNTGPIKGHGDKLFFVHTTLWAFLPWSLVLLYALYRTLKRKGITLPGNSLSVLTSSTLATFLLFSFSGFQLPHYIVLLLPQLALITAIQLNFMPVNTKTTLATIQTWVAGLCCLALGLITLYIAKGFVANLTFAVMAVCIVSMAFFKRYIPRSSMYINSTVFATAAVWFLNVLYYPMLLQWQAGQQAADFANASGSINTVYMPLENGSYSFEFYYKGAVKHYGGLPPADAVMVFAPASSIPLLTQEFAVKELKHFGYFRITKPTRAFLNKDTRGTAATYYTLANITPVK